MTKDFRDDIQLLRGIAVASVVIYHLRPDYLVSGYLGVDIFFVISGYLMGHLYDPTSVQEALNFYVRRLKRILPAYFAVIFATLAAGAFLLLPQEFSVLIRHAEYSLLLVPNAGFWADASYFDNDILKPLLHLWSLGVEMQFYLIFPAVAWLFRKNKWLIATIAVGSLVACFIMLQVSPKTAFFMLPFRLWEFLLGFLAAKISFGAGLKDGWRLFLASVILLLLCALQFVPLEETDHPGFSAFGIAGLTAAALVLRTPLALTASRLGRAFVVLGKYSYSIYLVHFPLVVFWLYVPFSGTLARLPTALETVMLVTLTGALGFALYHLVERPARASSHRWLVTSAALAFMSVASLVMLPPLLNARFSERELLILAASSDRTEYRCGKASRIADPTAYSCELVHAAEGGGTYLLVGDSHADAMKLALSTAAGAVGAGLRLTVNNCSVGSNEVCSADAILAEVLLRQMAGVIIHSSLGGLRPAIIQELTAKLRAADIIAIFIDPVPTWGSNVPSALFRNEPLQQTLEQYQEKNGPTLDALFSPDVETPRRLKVAPAICKPDCPLQTADGRPLYFDAGHLTLTGASLVVDALGASAIFVN